MFYFFFLCWCVDWSNQRTDITWLLVDISLVYGSIGTIERAISTTTRTHILFYFLFSIDHDRDFYRMHYTVPHRSFVHLEYVIKLIEGGKPLTIAIIDSWWREIPSSFPRFILFFFVFIITTIMRTEFEFLQLFFIDHNFY